MAPSNGAKSASKKSKSKISKLTLDSLPAGPKYGISPLPAPSTAVPSLSRRSCTSPVTQVLGDPMFLTSLANPIFVDVNGEENLQPPCLSERKTQTSLDGEEDKLWVDKYVPGTEAELAVHRKKVADVRRWLIEAFDGGPTGVLTKYRRILALTGPAGTGKTAVLQVLARELNFEIVEWCNAMDDDFSTDGDAYGVHFAVRESLTTKYQTFLSRAASCGVLSPSAVATSSATPSTTSRRIILLEDLPNVLHSGTADAFHDTLEYFIDSPLYLPLVLVISDAGTRGEDLEGDTLGSRRWKKEVIDVRSIVHPPVFNSPYFTEIQFNPVAPTLLAKALTNLLTQHFSPPLPLPMQKPNKDVVQLVVHSARGDIRSAIMTLQFLCLMQLPKGRKSSSARTVLEAVTRREQSLALFHMLGKVLYNKRKGDPPNPSASAPGLAREDELDMNIPDPPDPPIHLREHTRRGSRVDVNNLYADSPIDASLFALYLHQNYTQFCSQVDECDAVCEQLSWIDASGGEMWWQRQNPHQFHILTLGTLHGLPSPVPRRSQKIFKPEYFDVLKKSQATEESIIDIEAWVNAATEPDLEEGRRWGRQEIVLELSSILKAIDKCGTGNPPSTHTLFTKLSFVHPTRMACDNQRIQQLGEVEAPEGLVDDVRNASSRIRTRLYEEPMGGWLEDDDIQEF